MVIVVTVWWDGYECERDQVPEGFREVLCNCCLAPMEIFVPEGWPRIEALCRACDVSSGEESV